MSRWPGLEIAESKENESPGINGFTPIELLMTILLSGIFIVAFVPQMLSTSEEDRQYALLKQLHSVRGQIESFRLLHNRHLPAEGTKSPELFLSELNRHLHNGHESATRIAPFSDENVELRFLNPYTQRSGILVVPDRLEKYHYSGSGQHGWVYSSTTGEFRSNLSPRITDRSGRFINQL